jgi:hypothetical protein
MWADLPPERKAQLLRVLNRMMADRLAADAPAAKEGGHERH